MFDRFTAESRRVMALARKAAGEHGHDYIGLAHIFVGLLQVRRGRAAAILALSGDVERLRRAIEERLEPGSHRIVLGQVPFTPKSKSALERSLEVSTALDDRMIRPEHLLLGVLSVESPPLEMIREECPELHFDTVFKLVALLEPLERDVAEPSCVPAAPRIPDGPRDTVLAKPSRHGVEEVGLRERILLLVIAVPTVLAAIASPNAAGLILLLPGAVLLACALRPRSWN